MPKVKSELSKTLKTFVESMKNDDSKKETKMNARKDRAKMQDKNVKENAANDAAAFETTSGQSRSNRNVNSLSYQSKPSSAIVVNKSNTVRIVRPKEIDDSLYIIEELKMQQPVLVKLGSVEKEVRQRIMDRVTGACLYATLSLEQTDEQEILIDPSAK